MILKINIEQLFPRSEANWNRNRKRFVKLLAAANDLVANARASALLLYDESIDGRCIADSERRYFYRVACGHLYEAMSAFEECHRRGMLDRYRPLQPEGEKAVESLLAMWTGEGHSDLRNYLQRVRNHTFHYDYSGTLEGDGYLVFGQSQTRESCRFVVAEDAVLSHIHEQMKLASDEQFPLLLDKVVALRNDMLRFVDHFVAAVYENHREAFSLETAWPLP